MRHMTLTELYNLMTHEERIKASNGFYSAKLHQTIKKNGINIKLLHKKCQQNYKAR